MGKTTSRARGGFFFAVMALAMLSLVLMTVQVWVKTFEQSDYRASQRFKGEAMRSILASLSDRTLADFANASAFYATYRLADYTSNSQTPLLQDDNGAPSNNRGTARVNRTIFELMLDGTSEPNSGSPLQYTQEEANSYTISGWQNQTDAAANAMGFDVRFSDAKNFNYYQIDAWAVGVAFDMEMNITDAEGTMRQNKVMHAETSFPVSGFLDPMVTRNDMAHRNVERGAATEKQIFKLDEYNVPADVAPKRMRDAASPGNGRGIEGNGWFFGPIAEDYSKLGNSTGVDTNSLKQYVLVSPYNNGSVASIADSYGAVILTEEPELVTLVRGGCNVTRQTRCLNCMEKTVPDQAAGCLDSGWGTFSPGNNPVSVPVIVATNWKTDDVKAVTRAQAGGTSVTDHYVLIDNEKESSPEKMAGYHRIWDITRLRDMAICGFYVRGERGPSFFQRMLAGAESISNQELGIESFVVGQWAGGAEDKLNDHEADKYSRLDWEFYQEKQGNDVAMIKGMMGCKSKEMCSTDNATKIGLGHFRLSDDATSRYLSTLISCKATPSAPC
ncbi:MAG: hypothetical protein WC263_01740 [Candidatus Micrarchaeia archaeon]|jgi:hypothetical protein